MLRIRPRALVRSALVPVAVALAVSGSTAAFASGTEHRPARYSMQLSTPAATVTAGGATSTTISFKASPRLYRYTVTLSATGLPCGVTASFSPPAPLVSGTSTMTLSTSSSSTAGAFAVTVTAITNSSDPIGTSATFDLTINGS